VILKTTTASPVEVDLTPIVVHELRIVGSRCGDMQRAVDLLASGRIDPRPLVAARYALAEAVRALEHAAKPGVLKVILG
jgi:threonine dehydrogenase-like Zn-dependent dehydrogenase